MVEVLVTRYEEHPEAGPAVETKLVTSMKSLTVKGDIDSNLDPDPLPRSYLESRWPRLSEAEQIGKIGELQSYLQKRGTLGRNTFALLHSSRAEDKIPQTSLGDSYTLHRFLRARDFNVTAAADMYEQVMKFRVTNDADNLLESFSFTQEKELLKITPRGHFGVDREGRPIYIQKFGGVKYSDIIACTTLERLHKKNIQDFEVLLRIKLPACSRSVGYYVDSIVSIIDLSGLRLIDCDSNLRSLFLQMTRLFNDNYPDMLHRLIVVNAPAFFPVLFAIVKPFLSARSQSKIEVFSSYGYQKRLKELIDPKNLPKFLGGEASAEFPAPAEPGPWNIPGIFDDIAYDIPTPTDMCFSSKDHE